MILKLKTGGVTIEILNLGNACLVENHLDQPHVLISLVDRDPSARPRANGQTVATMLFVIYDVDASENYEYAFNKQRSDMLARFVLGAYKNGVKYFRINCMAGMSRSAAVGVAIAEYFEDHEAAAEIWNQKTPQRTIFSTFLNSLVNIEAYDKSL